MLCFSQSDRHMTCMSPGVVMAFWGATPAGLAKASAASRLLSLLLINFPSQGERPFVTTTTTSPPIPKTTHHELLIKRVSSLQSHQQTNPHSQWYVTHKTLHRPFPFVVQPHKASQYPRRLQTQIIVVVVVLSARPPSTTTTSRPHSFKTTRPHCPQITHSFQPRQPTNTTCPTNRRKAQTSRRPSPSSTSAVTVASPSPTWATSSAHAARTPPSPRSKTSRARWAVTVSLDNPSCKHHKHKQTARAQAEKTYP